MPINDDYLTNSSTITMSYSTYSNGYNVNTALSYINLYWLNSNPIFPKYSSDCANYISQILYISGMKEYYKAFWPIVGNIIQEDVQNWYMYDDHNIKNPSYTWTSAAHFFYHWTHYRASSSSASYSLWKIGDPVGCDWEKDGDTDHIIMIDGKTGNTKSTITYISHTSSRIKEPLTTIYSSKPNAYLRAIPMSTAKN